MDAIHIHRTMMKEYSRIDLGERYCFKCRKRRNFTDVILVPIDSMSYYGPIDKIVCDVCGRQDTDLFPGWTREGTDK